MRSATWKEERLDVGTRHTLELGREGELIIIEDTSRQRTADADVYLESKHPVTGHAISARLTTTSIRVASRDSMGGIVVHVKPDELRRKAAELASKFLLERAEHTRVLHQALREATR